MRTLIATILSIVTIIGGHFYNRRTDKALFFLSIFSAWAIGSFLFFFFLFLRTTELPQPDNSSFGYIRIGAIFIWIISVFVSFLDSRKLPDQNAIRLSISGKIGAVTMSLLMSIFSVSTVLHFLPENKQVHVRSSNIDYTFYNSLNFGGLNYPRSEFLPLPQGEGLIKGRFIFEGEPAKGIKLKLTLNGKYESDQIETDNEGIFRFNLPYGLWYINTISTSSWKDKPSQEHFMILTGQEGTLEKYKDFPFHHLQGNGLQINALENNEATVLEFVIRSRVHILWPGENAKGDVSTSIIHWEPYPEAVDYLICLTHVERNLSKKIKVSGLET